MFPHMVRFWSMAVFFCSPWRCLSVGYEYRIGLFISGENISGGRLTF